MKQLTGAAIGAAAGFGLYLISGGSGWAIWCNPFVAVIAGATIGTAIASGWG